MRTKKKEMNRKNTEKALKKRIEEAQSAERSEKMKVVEVRNPRTFQQQLSKSAIENYRNSIRREKSSSEPTETHNSATPVTPVTPVTIAAISKAKQKIKTAAYCRISTDMESQQTSIENLRQHFENEIRCHPDYEFAGVFLEVGVTGTKAEIRPELQRMIGCDSGRCTP